MKDRKRMLKLMYQRKLNNLTQAQLAEKVGVARNSITQYEMGLRRPSDQMLEKLAEVLNCTVNDIL